MGNRPLTRPVGHKLRHNAVVPAIQVSLWRRKKHGRFLRSSRATYASDRRSNQKSRTFNRQHKSQDGLKFDSDRKCMSVSPEGAKFSAFAKARRHHPENAHVYTLQRSFI